MSKPAPQITKRVSRRSFLRASAHSLAAAAALDRAEPESATAQASGPAVVLVEEGRPRATIVTAVRPSANAAGAARELQHYLEKMSGAALPIAADDAPLAGTLILVGRSRLTDRIPGLRIPDGRTRKLDEEGYVVECGEGRVVLAGNDTEPYFGTRYAICDFLHRLGIRWFLPGSAGEVVPASATIAVSQFRVVERPDFPMRNFWEHSRDHMSEDLQEWKIHNRMNSVIQDWFGVPGDGTLVNFLPHDATKTHPDWFALRRDGSRDDHMVCMTSPGTIAWMVDQVKQRARAGNRVTSFAPEDGVPRCYCDRCAAISSAFDGFGANDRDPWPEASTSQEWFYFVDQVLKGVNEEFPDHWIATNGYSNREQAPDLPDFNPRQNLTVMFANIMACTIHSYDDPRCWQMRRQGEMIRQWTQVCDKVWIYNYNYTMLVNKGTITPMVHRIRRTIPALKAMGTVGFNDQDEAEWSLCGIPTRIVRARLEWNTAEDVDAILADYFMRWYGPAAAPMQAYYGALESAFEQAPQHGHEDVVLPPIYTAPLLTRLDTLIAGAETAGVTEPYRWRVGLDRLIHDHLREYVALEAAKQQCRYAQASGHAGKMISLKAEMNRATPFMGWYPYPVYDADWERARMDRLAGLCDGRKGRLLIALPSEALFRTDPHDEGRYAGWHDPGHSEAGWTPLHTTSGWENQGFREQNGHPYRGIAWYRFRVDLPNSAGRAAGPEAGSLPVRLFLPAVVNEAWVWMNGKYVGHRPYIVPWSRPQELDLSLNRGMAPGKTNTVTVRVLCNTEVFGTNGIYERGFLYVPQS